MDINLKFKMLIWGIGLTMDFDKNGDHFMYETTQIFFIAR